MKKNIVILRITLWLGIILDLVEGVRMMMPNLFLSMTGAQMEASGGFGFGLLYGMPVMIGWAIVLFWADRKPLERVSILLCLIPVLILYVIVEIIGISSGLIPAQGMILAFVMQAILISLCVYSYLKNRNKKRAA